MKTKEQELDELQEEIRKLQASGMVNSLNNVFHNFFKIEQDEQEEADTPQPDAPPASVGPDIDERFPPGCFERSYCPPGFSDLQQKNGCHVQC